MTSDRRCCIRAGCTEDGSPRRADTRLADFLLRVGKKLRFISADDTVSKVSHFTVMAFLKSCDHAYWVSGLGGTHPTFISRTPPGTDT